MIQEEIFYLTKEGLAKIQKEFEGLKNLKLSKAKGEIPGTRNSEELDTEYLSFQEDLSFLESRIAELEHILKNAQLINPPPKEKRNVIQLGAKVLVEVDGQKDELEIVGTLEANPTVGKISNESPVGRILLGHKAGDVVLVSSPIKTTYKIKKIKYQTS